MTYTFQTECALEDGLLGGSEYPVEVNNVSLTSGAAIERGQLLAGTSGVYDIAGAADLEKSLCIAAENFTADSLNGGITQAYFAGKFNREKIKVGDSLTAADFEHELRKQNIHLTSRR